MEDIQIVSEDSEKPKPKIRMKSAHNAQLFKQPLNKSLAKMISKSNGPTGKLEYMSKDEMRHLLRTEYAGVTHDSLEKNFKDCCSEHDKCSEDLMKIADAITALYKMKPEQHVGRVQDMEMALQRKCAEIKK